MIGFFRRAMSSWVVLGLLGLVLIAFIVTGVGDPFGGMGGASSDKLATVGRTAIHDTQIRQQLDRAVRAARQQDPQVDTATYVRAGGFDQIMSQSIIAEAIKQWAEKNGFAVSRRQVDAEIASIPAFQINGRFDQASYEAALSQQKLSDRELREGLTGDLIRKQVLLPVSASATVTEGLVKPYAELLLEERTGTIGIVPAQRLADNTPPGDAAVQAFYKKNTSRYTVPERRVMRYALIGPEQISAAAIPSEADVQKFYNTNQAVYGASEKRKLSQIVLPDQAAAKAFADQAKTGDFAKLAATKGFGANDIAVGELSRSEFAAAASPQVAAAAFAAKAGGVTDPVQSDYGWHVVHVESVSTTAQKPLPLVRGEIVEKLTAQKRDEALADMVAKIEDAIADGQSMADVLKANRLTEATTPPLTSAGAAPDKPDYQAPPEIGTVVKAGFALAPDDDPIVEEIGKDHYAVVTTADIIEAAPRPLAEIKDLVTADLIRDRAFQKSRELAQAIITKVKAGTPLPQALAEAKMPPAQTATNRRIDVASQGERIPPPLAMLFTLPKDGVRMLAAPNQQGWFIVKVDAMKKGDVSAAPALVESTRAQFNQFAGEEYVAQFARAIAADVGLKRNEKAISRLKQDLLGGSTSEQ